MPVPAGSFGVLGSTNVIFQGDNAWVPPSSDCNSFSTTDFEMNCWVIAPQSATAPCPRFYFSTIGSAVSPQVLFGKGGSSYYPSVNMEQWGACTPCPAGTTNAGAGSSSCSPCESGAPCPCAAGYYFPPPPTFVAGDAPTPYVGNCLACPAGKASASFTAKSFSTCVDCAAGSYSSTAGRSACTLCPANSYTAYTGRDSSSYCIACTAGKTSPAGSATCT